MCNTVMILSLCCTFYFVAHWLLTVCIHREIHTVTVSLCYAHRETHTVTVSLRHAHSETHTVTVSLCYAHRETHTVTVSLQHARREMHTVHWLSVHIQSATGELAECAYAPSYGVAKISRLLENIGLFFRI